MHSFQPREVDAGAPWRWAREALGLLLRRPLAFGGAGLAQLLLFFGAMQLDPPQLRFLLALLLPPLTLGGFIRLAEAADHGLAPDWARFLPGNRELLRVLALAGVAYGVAFGLIFAFGGGLGVLDPSGSAAAPVWRDHLARVAGFLGLPLDWVIRSLLFGASLAAFCGLMLVLFSWFTLALAQAGLPVLQACLLSLAAYRLNGRRLGLPASLLLAGGLLAVLASLGLAAALLGPFVGALMYVSYREVFLGRAENAPVAAAGLVPAIDGRG